MKKKNLIILGIIVCVYITVSLLINFLLNINNVYIVFPDNVNLKYEKTWQIFSDEETLNNQYEIIENGNFVSSRKLTIKDGIIYGDNVELVNDTIAYRGTKIGNIPYKNEELNEEDYKYLLNILNSKNINIDVYLTLNIKYTLDLNGDGNLETIYSVSNNYDTELGKLFSIIVIKNNNIIIQYNEFDSEYDSYIPYIYFIDLDKDNKVDMIIKNVYSSLTGQDIKLLSFKQDLSYEYVFEEEIR